MVDQSTMSPRQIAENSKLNHTPNKKSSMSATPSKINDRPPSTKRQKTVNESIPRVPATSIDKYKDKQENYFD